MTPQPYNRLYQLTGSKGFANKYPVEGYALDADQLTASGVEPKVDDLNSHGFLPEVEMEALVAKYQHPILKKYGDMAKEVGGHGGMDFIMDSRLVYCLQTACLWIWMYMIWRSGVAWQNWASFLWITIVLRLHSPILLVASGMW